MAFLLIFAIELVFSSKVIAASYEQERLSLIIEIEAADKSQYLKLLGIGEVDFQIMDKEKLKRIYRDRSKLVHPDKFKDLKDPGIEKRAEEAFKKMNNAYDALRISVGSGKPLENKKSSTTMQSEYPFRPGYVPNREYYKFTGMSESEQTTYLNSRIHDVDPNLHDKREFYLVKTIMQLIESGPYVRFDANIAEILKKSVSVYETKTGNKVDIDNLFAQIIDEDSYLSFEVGDNFGTRTNFLATWILLPQITVEGGRKSYLALERLLAKLYANNFRNLPFISRYSLVDRIRQAQKTMKQKSGTSKSTDGLKFAVTFCREVVGHIRGY